jgi:hypothetical protein
LFFKLNDRVMIGPTARWRFIHNGTNNLKWP